MAATSADTRDTALRPTRFNNCHYQRAIEPTAGRKNESLIRLYRIHHSIMDSPFAVLGVDADADQTAIRRAYRQRAKETHPDRGGSDDEFKAVQAAYDAIISGDTPDRATTDFVENISRTEQREPGTHVTYLNYEVLDDHGWSIDDDDLFTKAAAAGLNETDYGRLTVDPNETLLEGAERSGHAWPYACRGGACANCAVAVCEGELSQLVDHILSDDLTAEGIRLSCNGTPQSDEMRVVFNLKNRPDLADLKLPGDRFSNAYAGD